MHLMRFRSKQLERWRKEEKSVSKELRTQYESFEARRKRGGKERKKKFFLLVSSDNVEEGDHHVLV